MGVLEVKLVQIKRTVFKTFYKFSEEFGSSDKQAELNKRILSYQPH